MVGMLCVIVATGVWLVVATLLHMPVSTTQATVGGIIGVALVAKGTAAVQWEGVGLIVASWFLSTVLSAALSGGLYALVRHVVLRSDDSYQRAFAALPILVGVTLAINAFFIVYEGPQALAGTPLWLAIVIALGVGVVSGLVTAFGIVPWVRRHVQADLKDAAGDTLLSQPSSATDTASTTGAEAPHVEIEMPRQEGDVDAVEGESTGSAASDSHHEEGTSGLSEPQEDREGVLVDDGNSDSGGGDAAEAGQGPVHVEEPVAEPSEIKGGVAAEDAKDAPGPSSQATPWWSVLTAGMDVDVHRDGEEGGRDAAVADMHAAAEAFEPRTERVFSYLQVVTAMFDSFGHGANDVANSVGPLAAIVSIYETSRVGGQAEVPLWILALGGVGLVVGLATLGHHIIRAIGVRLTKVTPSRGFTIELGAAFVIVVGSRLGLPLSTTQAQVGSTAGVGLCEGRRDAVNWSEIGHVFLGWCLTLLVTGSLSAALFAFAVFSPNLAAGTAAEGLSVPGNATAM